MFPGLGGMDPRRMKQLMRQMGIKNEEIDAKRVVFELAGGSKLVFENPQVSAIELGGQKTYTIIGSPKEEKGELEAGHSIPEADVEMVAGQAKVSKEKARRALEETSGDIAEAIQKLSK